MRLLQQMIKVKEEYTARFSAQNFTREPLILVQFYVIRQKRDGFLQGRVEFIFRHSRIEVDCGMERE